jgi:hypothetical protein
MILYFPNLHLLRLAITTTVIPEVVSAAGAKAGFEGKGGVCVQPGVVVSEETLAELGRHGVHALAAADVPLGEEVSCWPQLLPLERVADILPQERAPILFDLPGEQLFQMAGEVLRLGNDRQSYRWVRSVGEDRALLRVLGPPYYSLLRALDRDGRAKAPVAHVEMAPQVWLEVGYRHPLGDQLRPPPGKILLLRAPRTWLFLDDAPFHDIYELLEFSPPETAVQWHDAELSRRLTVPLRLDRGSPDEAAELWVLRDRPMEQLDALVSHADDQLLRQLSFAAADEHGRQVIVLRARPSRSAPPVLVLDAAGFRSYLKLPNLFLPCGTRLHPPLRRDTIRQLLAEDPAVLTWLYPQENGRFVPETLPDEAFRPLSEWVDYVIDHERQELQLWVESAQFDFESFVIAEESPRKPAKAEESAEQAPSKKGPVEAPAQPKRKEVPTKPRKETRRREAEPEIAQPPKREPGEAQKQLRALEERFLRLEGPLDSPARRALWPELANLNAALGNNEEAGQCWLQALWLAEAPPPPWLRTWFLAEAGAVPVRPEAGSGKSRSWVSRLASPRPPERGNEGADLDSLLALVDPTMADVRALAACLVGEGSRSPPGPAVVARLGPLQHFLETHEALLPVRSVWLAWLSLARLVKGDVLALARARDRLLERLLREGLRPEVDLPSFLRSAGHSGSEHARSIHRWFAALRQTAQRWVQDMGPPPAGEPQTPAYVDLLFAFGLARLGERKASQEQLRSAQRALQNRDDVHGFLLEAFGYRIQQALAGKPLKGPLPAEQMEYLEHLRQTSDQERTESGNKQSPNLAYFIDRLRFHSRVLEPDQQIGPYRHEKAGKDPFLKALARLPDLLDRQAIIDQVQRLLNHPPRGKSPEEERARVLTVAFDPALRVGEQFALELLGQVLPTYEALSEPRDVAEFEEHAHLLQKALFVAAHFDAAAQLQSLVGHFRRLLQSPLLFSAPAALDSLTGTCLRGLRKLGMRDEIDFLLNSLTQRALQGQSLKELRPVSAKERPAELLAMLHVAAGWFYFGRNEEAEAVLNVARAALFQNVLDPARQTELACTYATALGYAPVDQTQERVDELFHRLEGVRDTFTTSSYYSRFQLAFVESVVLALVSEDFTLGTAVRRWLDDEEFLVRQRIHRDLREWMAQAERG